MIYPYEIENMHASYWNMRDMLIGDYLVCVIFGPM
jgi:hypothetical protein